LSGDPIRHNGELDGPNGVFSLILARSASAMSKRHVKTTGATMLHNALKRGGWMGKAGFQARRWWHGSG